MDYFNVYSSNNCWGWLCMFAAHLIRNCGIERSKIEEAVLIESDGALFKRGYQSDHQCIMTGNRWFYRFFKIDESWECDGDEGVRMSPEIFREGLNYWLERA